MSFDPATFEAEVTLKRIPTERLPAVAQDALEAGFDGPHVLRMAILEPTDVWALDEALRPMLEELGCQQLSTEGAALHLARQRAKRILGSNEDPAQSLPYFHDLMVASDYADELTDLGYLEDDYDFITDDNVEERRTRAYTALRELLDPELRQKRIAERKARWEQEQARIKSEWPYVLNSPSGRALLKERYLERITDMLPLLWIEAAAWIVLGWAFSSWRTAVIGYIVSMPLLFALPVWGEYLRLRRERRDTLLRRGVPDELI